MPSTDQATALLSAWLLGFTYALLGHDHPIVNHLAYLVGEWLQHKPGWRDLSKMLLAGSEAAIPYRQ